MASLFSLSKQKKSLGDILKNKKVTGEPLLPMKDENALVELYRTRLTTMERELSREKPVPTFEPTYTHLVNLKDNYYYSVINGNVAVGGVETQIYSGALLKEKWQTLKFTRYSTYANLPDKYMMVSIPDGTSLAAKEYGVFNKKWKSILELLG